VTQALLNKTRVSELIQFLTKKHKVVGPTPLTHGQFKFSEITSWDEIDLDYIPTLLPPKKYFLPQKETLLHYNIDSEEQGQVGVEIEKTVLFGLHTCDLAGIQCLNMVFADRPKDLHYMIRKQHFTLIGLECNDYCDNYANCAMLFNHQPKGGYDLFFTELKDCYMVDINTHKGDLIVEKSGLFKPTTPAEQKELRQLRKRKKQIFKSELPIAYQDIVRLFEETFDSNVWVELGRRCLSCGNCTNVCPTCYCFDIIDEPDWNLKQGRRTRSWDSCQHEEFARIAGDENFRKERSDRQRHRFNRKFHYPVERYKRIFCTGCGRCSRTCMAKINLKETLNALIECRG
jgi:sulfhydrogenase subunit beta (sulfur reductase)